MPKLTFTVACEAASHDPKTMVPCVKLMQLVTHGPCYMFPPELQGRDLHEQFLATTTGKLARKAVAICGSQVSVNVCLVCR